MHASCSLLPATSIMLFVCKTTEKKASERCKAYPESRCGLWPLNMQGWTFEGPGVLDLRSLGRRLSVCVQMRVENITLGRLLLNCRQLLKWHGRSFLCTGRLGRFPCGQP